jgi:hypothetical protein
MTSDEPARAGDWIEVRSTVDGPARRGVILEVLGRPGHVHYRVRWDEEHESFFFPAHADYLIHRRSGQGPPAVNA